MKKFINDRSTIVNDTIAGFLSAYGDRVKKVSDASVITRRTPKSRGRVALMIGNGSGHEPACIGFVGRGMLDANAYGGLFAAPGPDTTAEAIRAADRGAGVVVFISNHAGDVINSRLAIEMAEDDGVTVREVLLYDDVASAPASDPTERRGTAGTVFAYKMVGAFAEESSDIDAVVAFANEVRDNTRTLTVAGTPGTNPLTGRKMFEIGYDEVQFGIGVHGEQAANTLPFSGAAPLAETMVDRLVSDGGFVSGDGVAVLVNGMGATTAMELNIFYGGVAQALESRGITAVSPLIGSYVTTQEMGGIALSLCKVDATMRCLWEAETDAPAFAPFPAREDHGESR